MQIFPTDPFRGKRFNVSESSWHQKAFLRLCSAAFKKRKHLFLMPDQFFSAAPPCMTLKASEIL